MKTGRNDPCPCGSGKKWKKCCAAVAATEPAPAVAAEPVDDSGAATTDSEPPQKGGGRDWVPLQHQQGRLRQSNFGRKKPR